VEKDKNKFQRKILRRKDFPELLREIPDPLEKVYLIGDIPGAKNNTKHKLKSETPAVGNTNDGTSDVL